jgi:predicted Kef-type K+ transport protein
LYLAAAGAFAIIVLGIGLGLRAASFVGVALTLAGSLTSAFEPRLYRKESW